MRICIFFALLFVQIISIGAHGAEVSFDSDVQIHSLATDKSSRLGVGESYMVRSSEAMVVESEGKIPLLLLPLSSNEKTKIHLVESQSLKCTLENPTARNEIETNVSQVIVEVFRLQELIQQKKMVQANELYRNLSQKYKGVAALEFIGGSLALIDRDYVLAEERLKRALLKHPDFAEGQKLSEKIQKRRGGAQ